MEDNEETYQSQRERIFDFVKNDDLADEQYLDQKEEFNDDDYDYDFDNTMNELDFSSMTGKSFKRSLGNVKKKIGHVLALLCHSA